LFFWLLIQDGDGLIWTVSSSKKFPWEVDAALLPERLRMIAIAVRDARGAAIDARDPRDDNWCTGTRAFTWTKVSISALQRGAASGWLRTQTSGLSFTFYVGGVRMKFYRGPADQPTANSLRSSVREMLAQGQFEFFGDEIDAEEEGWFWLMAIDTDIDGRALEVVVLQANAQRQTRFDWSIPIDGLASSISDISDARREGTDLEPAEPGLLGDEDAKAVGDDNDKDDDEK